MKTKFRTIFKKAFYSELEPIFGCTLLAIICIIYFAFNQKVIGLSMPLSFVGYKLMELLGIDIPTVLEDTQLASSINGNLFTNSGFALVIGFAIGCTVVPLYRGEYHIKGVESRSQLLMMIIGGFLIGFGVQGMYGANIGEIYSAMSMMSLSGYIVVPFIVLGLFIGRPLYEKLAYESYWTKMKKKEKTSFSQAYHTLQNLLFPKRLYD